MEIDPTVVRIAREHFGVRDDRSTQATVADGLQFLSRTERRYDTIYMDAYSNPSVHTNRSGVPLPMLTRNFYGLAQTRLRDGGLMVFNLSSHDSIDDDIRIIREAFPETYPLRMKNGHGFVVIASTAATPPPALPEAACEIDRRFRAGFSFEKLVRAAGL